MRRPLCRRLVHALVTGPFCMSVNDGNRWGLATSDAAESISKCFLGPKLPKVAGAAHQTKPPACAVTHAGGRSGSTVYG